MTLNKLKKELKTLANPEKAGLLQRFFKTGPGQYGEGDVFYGVMVPQQRQLSKRFVQLSLCDLEKLLHSKIHEERLTALIILVDKFKKADDIEKKKIYNLYLENTKWINNWDLVDLTAPHIVGGWLFDKDRKILYRLADSKNLWERRIAVLAAFYFIRQGENQDVLRLAKRLLNDKHDLMHKAVGWMLREVGKNCGEKTLTDFLDQYYQKMPRTMLRYSIEKLTENKRQKYLKK